MRSFYEVETAAAAARANRLVPRLLQIVTLAYWAPCIAADTLLLFKGHGQSEAMSFVFGLLFRQALVFLTLWFTVALCHGLVRGGGAPRLAKNDGGGRKARRLKLASGFIAGSR